MGIDGFSFSILPKFLVKLHVCDTILPNAEAIMELRRTKYEDIADVMSIINDSIAGLKNAGIDQWQNGYPNAQSIENDIRQGWGYVLTHGEAILATLALCFEPDPNYTHIFEGQWINLNPYAVIHRIAVKMSFKGQGLALIAMKQCEEICLNNHITNIKVDTHRHNHSMQRMLKKAGYQMCGIIYLADGAERFGLQKVLREEI
jgi:predicted GNAT family N-acyltransferase